MNRLLSLAVIAVVILLGFGIGGVNAQSPGPGADLVTLTAEVAELRSRISVLEAQVEISDKHLATQADVVAVESNLKLEIAGIREGIAGVRADVVWLKWVLSIAGGLVVFLGGWIVKLLKAGASVA